MEHVSKFKYLDFESDESGTGGSRMLQENGDWEGSCVCDKVACKW